MPTLHRGTPRSTRDVEWRPHQEPISLQGFRPDHRTLATRAKPGQGPQSRMGPPQSGGRDAALTSGMDGRPQVAAWGTASVQRWAT